MALSRIEWTDYTFNPWIGCTKISPGCAHCYAETRDRRHLQEKVDHWGPGAPRMRTSAANWKLPRRWNKLSLTRTDRPRVFCASLADWLDDEVPIEWLADLLELIHATPHLDWLLLTKRPENFAERMKQVQQLPLASAATENYNMAFDCWIGGWIEGLEPPPTNVWIGTTVEDQTRADERIPTLLQIPAKVRFLSCEPLLGPVRLDALHDDELGAQWNALEMGIHWVICGGESGAEARPMHPAWARSLREQCQASGVPFFFKQWGEWWPYPQPATAGANNGVGLCLLPNGRPGSQGDYWEGRAEGMERVGKKAAGRLLDGREWNEFPSLAEPCGPSRKARTSTNGTPAESIP
jgi:protein gp37